MIRVNIDSISDLTARQKAIKSNLNQVKSNITSHKNGLDFEISKRSSVLNSYNNLYSKLSNITNDMEQLQSVLNLAVIQYSTAETKVQIYMKNTFGNISDKNVGDICIKENDKNSNKKSSLLEKIWNSGKDVRKKIDEALDNSGNALSLYLAGLGKYLANKGIKFSIKNGKLIVRGSHSAKINANVSPYITRMNIENITKYPTLNKIFKSQKVLDKLEYIDKNKIFDKLAYGWAVVKGVGEIFSEDNKGKDIAHVLTDVRIETVYNVGVTAASIAASKLAEKTIGAKIGAVVGGAVGSIFPGAGTVVGAVVGTAVGIGAASLVSKGIEWIATRDFDKDGKNLKDEIKDGAANLASNVYRGIKGLFNKGNGNGKLNFC